MRMLLVVVVNSIALLISLSSVFVTGRFVLFRMRMRVIRMFVGFVVVIVLRVRLVCVLVVAVAAIFLLLLLGHPRGGGALLLLLLLMILRRRPAVRVLIIEFDAGFVADGQRQSRVAVRPRSRQSLRGCEVGDHLCGEGSLPVGSRGWTKRHLRVCGCDVRQLAAAIWGRSTAGCWLLAGTVKQGTVGSSQQGASFLTPLCPLFFNPLLLFPTAPCCHLL